MFRARTTKSRSQCSLRYQQQQCKQYSFRVSRVDESSETFNLLGAMFSGLLFGKNAQPSKGFKVTSVERDKKYGIAANSLRMLKEKAAEKFKIKNCKIFLAKDGTEVQDETYFGTIEPQTLFVVAPPDAVVKTDFQLVYECIKKSQTTVFSTADIIRNFVNENRTEFDRFISDLQSRTHSSNENTMASLRSEHEEWFEGVPSSIATKEEVMARRSQDRIRGYFYKTKEECMKSDIYRTNAKARELLKRILDIFQHFLIGVDHFSSLFNRKWENRHKIVLQDEADDRNDDVDATANAPPRKKRREMIRNAFSDSQLKSKFYVSLCDPLGEFRCHGSWNSDTCKYKGHRINPYASRENVVLFQVWNLDHQIEITRSIIPALLADVARIADGRAMCRTHNKRAKTVSIVKYFLELFTMDNLKLVHIVCHDKGCHSLKSKGTIICVSCKEYKTIERFMGKIK